LPDVPTESALGRALRVSTQQLLLIRADDVDGYVEGLSHQEEAFAILAKLDVAALSEAERGQLERLAQTNAEILDTMHTWMSNEKIQMAKLREARNTARAYGAVPPPVPIRSISA